jgi:uncharacterized membrane protein (UPF0127 family)
MNDRHFLANVAGSATPWGLRVGGTERWLAQRAELAGTSQERRRGLLGRDHLDDGAALVIAPTQGIHTFGMRFPLDVVGVDRRGVVVSIRQGVPRRRVVLSLRAFAMVELGAGGCQACGLRVGERLDAVSQNASWGASGG